MFNTDSRMNSAAMEEYAQLIFCFLLSKYDIAMKFNNNKKEF